MMKLYNSIKSIAAKEMDTKQDYDDNQNSKMNNSNKIMIDDDGMTGSKGYQDDYRNEADSRNDGKILIE